jgi:hypothetical protein
MTAPKLCFDRILPAELNRPRRLMSVRGRDRAIIQFRKMWVNGSTLKVRFLEGNSDQRAQVVEEAKRWTEHANLKFVFVDDPDADIRIKFDSGDGAWSYVGTDAHGIPQQQATMNLGFLDRGTSIHEFGHAIGLSHEHQNPEGGIIWNEAEVLRDLQGPPNNWTPAQIRHNVLNKYTSDQIRGTAFDRESIMLYAFPARWTLNTDGTQSNDDLSAEDIRFIESVEAYPGRVDEEEPLAQAVELDVIDTAGVSADIGKPGEEDLFKFQVEDDGRHTIETDGQTDVFMSLFGPDSQTRKIAEDDDGGAGRNSKIVADLVPGEYFVQIRHFNRTSGTGRYSIRVTR